MVYELLAELTYMYIKNLSVGFHIFPPDIYSDTRKQLVMLNSDLFVKCLLVYQLPDS